MQILCMGEALIDIVAAASGISEMPVTPTEHPGGSVYNVALGLARLEVPTGLASWWGKDARGQSLTHWCQQAGVRLIPGSDQAPWTSTAQASIDASGQARYTFNLCWDLPQIPPAGFAEYQHLHIGSYSALLAPGADKVAQYVEQRGGDVTLSYDPNLRPALVSDLNQARAQVNRLARLSDLVKASEEDIEFLCVQAVQSRPPAAQSLVITQSR